MPSGLPGHDLDYQHLTFDRLQAIIPVAMTDPRDHIHFTLQSVERYDAGFIVNLDVELHMEMPTPETGYDPSTLPPELRGTFLATSAVDSLGNSYNGFMRAGHGGGRSDGVMEMRFVHVFGPGLALDASNLTLTIHMLERMRYQSDGRIDLTMSDVTGGPWEVTFPLGAESRSEAPSSSVVPIGQQLRRDDVELTVLSLERSSIGFRIIARLDWTGPAGQFPSIIWHATDDLDNTYRTANCAGGGGGAMPSATTGTHPQSWRMDCIFSKPIVPEASRITLTVEAITFKTPIQQSSDPASPHWHQSGQLEDLGSVIVDLT